MSQTAVRVVGLGKEYHIGAARQRYSTLRDRLSSAVRVPMRRLVRLARRRAAAKDAVKFWALEDLSFEMQQGDALGVLGRNGAGKSTLLKILSQITEPSTGYAEIFGRASSLLEVGTGFHPELTGRENIYLNGAILGMSKAQIEQRFDAIVDFAGVEKFVDTAVKHYSSGMGLRLGFAVAAFLEPDIIIVDEILAVGDAAFQRKCLGRMGDVAKGGRTVIFVSHDLTAVESLCNKAIILDQGKLSFQGTARDAVARYLSELSDANGQSSWTARRPGEGKIRFTGLKTFCNRVPTLTLMSGSDVELQMEYRVDHPDGVANVRFHTTWSNQKGQRLFTCISDRSGEIFPRVPGPTGMVSLLIPRFPLTHGIYSVEIVIKSDGAVQDSVADAAQYEVQGGDFYGTGRSVLPVFGPFLVPHEFKLQDSGRNGSSERKLG